MTDDLVKRLRDWAECEDDIMIEAACSDFHMAADRIEELEAALKKNAQHHMQSIEIAMDALRPGEPIRDTDWNTLEIERMHGYVRKEQND